MTGCIVKRQSARNKGASPRHCPSPEITLLWINGLCVPGHRAAARSAPVRGPSLAGPGAERCLRVGNPVKRLGGSIFGAFAAMTAG